MYFKLFFLGRHYLGCNFEQTFTEKYLFKFEMAKKNIKTKILIKKL